MIVIVNSRQILLIDSNKRLFDKTKQTMDNCHRCTGTGSQVVPRRKAGASLDPKSEDIYRIRCSHVGSTRSH